jgi:hypothetical protein
LQLDLAPVRVNPAKPRIDYSDVGEGPAKNKFIGLSINGDGRLLAGVLPVSQGY